jgi:Protein required for attachment to host cells
MTNPARDPATIWILVADERGARLMCGHARAGRLRLDPGSDWTNAWAELASVSDAVRPGLTPGRTSVSRRAELLQRYVADLGRWIHEQARANGVKRLEVFAPAGLLGTLRRSLPGDLTIGEHAHDLGHLDRAKLATHPAVAGLARRAAG